MERSLKNGGTEKFRDRFGAAEFLIAQVLGLSIVGLAHEGGLVPLSGPIDELVELQRRALGTLFGVLGLTQALPGWLLETGWLSVATIVLIFQGVAKAMSFGIAASYVTLLTGVAAGLGIVSAYFDLPMADVISDGPTSFVWSATSSLATATLGFVLRHQVPGRVFWHVGSRMLAIHAAGAVWLAINWGLVH